MVMKIVLFGKWIRNNWEVLNVTLEKNGEDQVDRLCEKRSLT